MVYSVKVIDTKELYNSGTTDANGETEIFYSDIADKAYLYIGHRTEKFEDLPTSRSTPEQISDECNLNNGGDQQITMTPHEENKTPITVQTQRLWKPWIISENFKNDLRKSEGFKENFYDLGDGGITFGYGHYTPYNIELKNKTKKKNFEIDKIRARYPNGITKEEAENLMLEDIQTSAKPKKVETLIYTPMHQYEFDALISMRFNNADTTEAKWGRSSKLPHQEIPHQISIADRLNAGQYTLAGKTIPTIYNTVERKWTNGLQNRRDHEMKVFLNEKK